MAENDVTVTIGVDTSQLDAGLAQVKQAAAVAGGAVAAAAGGATTGPGGAPPGAGGAGGAGGPGAAAAAAGAAAAAAAPGMQQAAGAANNLAQAQNNVATASNNAGNAFERMLNRMLMRLGILYAIHEAIKLITEVLQESSAYEVAQVRFENLSTAVEGSAKAWEHLRQVAHETGISTEDLSQAQMSLEKMGASGGDVGGVMENLAKYSKITGENVGTLAQEWGRLERKEGSVKDMQDLAYATHDINLQRLVNDLAETQRLAPIVAEQQAQINRQINRAADDTDRLRQAQIGVAQALHLSGQAYQQFIGGGRAGGPAEQLTGRLRGELELGATQLAREGEPTVRQMRSMGESGKEIYQILMQAAERYHERVREMIRRQEEDARENVRLKAAHDLLAAEDRVAQAIQAGIGANTAFGKAMETAAGLSDLIKEHMKEIVDDAKIVNDAIKDWNTMILNFIDNIKQVGVIIDNVLKKIQQLVPWHPTVHDPTLETPEETATRRAPHPNRVPGFLGRQPEPTAADKFNEMTKKQDEQKKEQQDANKKLDQIHGVLQQAFGT